MCSTGRRSSGFASLLRHSEVGIRKHGARSAVSKISHFMQQQQFSALFSTQSYIYSAYASGRVIMELIKSAQLNTIVLMLAYNTLRGDSLYFISSRFQYTALADIDLLQRRRVLKLYLCRASSRVINQLATKVLHDRKFRVSSVRGQGKGSSILLVYSRLGARARNSGKGFNRSPM